MRKTLAIAGLVSFMAFGASVSAQSTPTQTPQPQTPQAQAPQGQAPTSPSASVPRRNHRSLEERFKRLDRNADGKISREEWPRKPEAFDRLDANHDGVLTQDELQAAAAKRHQRKR
jgi:hypothetical protein